MRFPIFPVLVVVPFASAVVQCSSNSSDDSAGGAGTSASGHAGVGGAGRGGAGGAGGRHNTGTAGEAGAANVSGAAAGEGGSGTAEGGQPSGSEAGSDGMSMAGTLAAGGGGGTGGAHAGGGGGGVGGVHAGGSSGTGGGGVHAGGSSGAGGGGGAPGTVPPIAHFGQVRFLNLAPLSSTLDFCVKRTSAPSYPATPILQGAGISAGVPYESQTKYVDVALTGPPDTYDFVFVEGAGTTCDPPILGAFGSLTLDPNRSTTIAVFQIYFTSSVSYGGAVFADYDGQAPSTGNVRAFYAANVLSSAVDFHALRPTAIDDTWYPNFSPGDGTPFHVSPVATYEFRATKKGTQTVVADKLGVVIAAGDPVDLFLYQSGVTQQSLIGCPSKPEAAVGACTR